MQERACGHQNCTPCKPIRAACVTFNMSKIKTAQTRLYSYVCACGLLSCRIFSLIAVFVVFFFVLEAIEKCEQALDLRHDRCQQDHQMNWSLRVLTCNVWTPINLAQANLRRQVCGSVCTCGRALPLYAHYSIIALSYSELPTADSLRNLCNSLFY